jgi:hypothetical protein
MPANRIAALAFPGQKESLMRPSPHIFAVLLILGIPSIAHTRPCSHFGAYPCPDMEKCTSDLKETAEWVIEGTIVGIEPAGKQTECEHSGTSGPPICSDINRPELIHMTGVHVVRGTFRAELDNTTTISRKDICFGGPIAKVMNQRPELGMTGKKVVFYGDDSERAPFLKKGFFFVEVKK